MWIFIYITTNLYKLSMEYIMANDYEIFEGKSLSDLFKDIYDNTERNKTQLEVLMKEVTSFIKVKVVQKKSLVYLKLKKNN